MNIRIKGKVVGTVTTDRGWFGYELSDGKVSTYLYHTVGEAREAGEARYRQEQANAAFDANAAAALGPIADPFAPLVRK